MTRVRLPTASVAAQVSRHFRQLRLQILDFEVSVALGRGHPSVTQELLHGPQVGPGAQGMGGGGAAQHMRPGAIGDAGRSEVAWLTSGYGIVPIGLPRRTDPIDGFHGYGQQGDEDTGDGGAAHRLRDRRLRPQPARGWLSLDLGGAGQHPGGHSGCMARLPIRLRLGSFRSDVEPSRGSPGSDAPASRRCALCLYPIPQQSCHLRLQILDFEVSVALGGGDPGVAQEFLHRPQIGPGAQGVGGAADGLRRHEGIAPVY